MSKAQTSAAERSLDGLTQFIGDSQLLQRLYVPYVANFQAWVSSRQHTGLRLLVQEVSHVGGEAIRRGLQANSCSFPQHCGCLAELLI